MTQPDPDRLAVTKAWLARIRGAVDALARQLDDNALALFVPHDEDMAADLIRLAVTFVPARSDEEVIALLVECLRDRPRGRMVRGPASA